ncbi:hypothetical protein BDW59DRAFT_66223 [Aspergillus cavernicola]|uniref:Uncharacterized protein n=1 Tax=Aspergillus cavernicola TaxID=176166 RepID=A0ABR4IEV6_9EURO
MISTIPKTVLLSLSLSTATLAAVQAKFNRYFETGCPSLESAATIVEGYCTNLESFPTISLDAYVTSGECEDPTTSPVLSLFADPGCETGLLLDVAIGAEAQCVEAEITIESLTITCV